MPRINKKLLVVFLLVAVFGAGYFCKDRAINYVLDLPQVEEPVDNFFSEVEEVAKEVFTPPPLRVEKGAKTVLLSREGVVKWTNVNREENNLLSLAESTQLNYAAVEKLNDMFENQYFAHVSPSGLGVTHWVGRAGYEYLLVGENLALGNFEDDADLVRAWMDSPGHRENILNDRYTEIGVAAGVGIFEGKETWLAVQIFGKPVSDCSQPSASLESKIKIYETNISKTENNLVVLKAQIESINLRRRVFRGNYNKLVEEYNELVVQYNNFVEELRKMIKEYNIQVKAFNNCVGSL